MLEHMHHLPRSAALFLLLGVLIAADTVQPPTDPGRFHLFLLMGQSNMQGHSKPYPISYDQPDPHVLVLQQNGTWRVSAGPSGGGSGIGPGDAFARAYAALHPDVTVGIVPGAKGGRSIKELAKGAKDRDGDPIYDRVMALAVPAGKVGTFKALLWHQGEADVGNPTYFAQLNELVGHVRSDLAIPDLPLIAGELGGFAGWTGAFNNELPRLPTEISHAAVASSDLLGHIGDAVHFSGPAADLFGRRYLVAYTRLVEPTLTAAAERIAAQATPALPRDSGLLANGDMEDGGDVATGWDQVWTKDGTLVASRDTTMPHGGSAALRIDSGGKPADGNVSLALPIERVAGHYLLVRGWIRSEGELKHAAACFTTTGGTAPRTWTTILEAKSPQRTWLRFSSEVAVPVEAGRAALCFLVTGTGVAWIDDVEVLEVPGRMIAAQGRPVLNGDMELGDAIPDAWDGLYTASGSLVAARDTTVKHNGTAALRLATGTAGGDGNANQSLPGAAVAGKSFRVRGVVRGEGPALRQCALCVSARDKAWKTVMWKTVVDAAGKPGAWMDGSIDVTFPANTERASVCLLVSGTGTGWLDDVVIEALP
jgi:hypothetical protein